RGDQRAWLDYAQRACTDDAQPLTRGSYPELGGSCLVEKFNTRSGALEQSRMIGGHRFLIKALYAALPDPDEVDNPDSYWKVASHEAVMPQLEAGDPLAEAFNRYVMTEAARDTETLSLAGASDVADLEATADSSLNIAVKELGGTSRITMMVNTYWFGHGAAHGQWSVSYLHYLTGEERGLRADDMFAGKDWQVTLRDAAWAELQAEHGDWLQVEAPADIAEIVIDPTRWDLSNDHALVIQFQPYEVSAYAYGAPTIRIPWDRLEAIKAETQDQVIWGY
ncbi:MAG TPA: RsiV family protein, partial [Devosia sp.]|nr:RsiV family protein [Devosia sp.]